MSEDVKDRIKRVETIYGDYYDSLQVVRDRIQNNILQYQRQVMETTDEKYFEHLSVRIKTDESMREKCRRKGLPETARSALHELKDSIGIRIVCPFINDVYDMVETIRGFDNCRVVEEKDYIRHVKDNGYRSYHMIVVVETEFPDVLGRTPGQYFVEIQIRTIAMDTWASLEHRMKYKKNIPNQELLVAELKRCADELASCDLTMQTIKELIDAAEDE